MNKLYLLLLILTTSLWTPSEVIAQSNDAKAKAYYFSAQDSFEAKNYSQALDLLDKAENASGETNAYIEALRAECYAKKSEWMEAKKALDNCFNLNPSNETLKRVSPLLITVDEKIEAAREAERKRIAEEQRKEKERILKEREAERKRLEEAKKDAEIAERLEPLIREDLEAFKKLTEGKPYQITSRKASTNSSKEKHFLIFYGGRYIVYIVPDIDKIDNLYENSIRYSSYTSKDNDENRIYVKRRDSEKFRESVFYNNLAVSDDGRENILFHGSSYEQAEKRLYYFYWNNYLHADFNFYEEFKKEVHNPQIETGVIDKFIEYDYVKDPELLQELKDMGFKNKTKKRSNPTNGLVIQFTPKKYRRVVFPTKKITFNRTEQVVGNNWNNGVKSKQYYWYMEPLKVVKQAGYVQINWYYNSSRLLPNITDAGYDYRMDKFVFDSWYTTWSKDIGNGKQWIHANEGFWPIQGLKWLQEK